jgi:oligopeptide/dipeptide ABC transporter ATP-binding protein
MSAILVQAEGLVKHFPVERGAFSGKDAVVHAVDGVSLSIKAGETLACVGESGCGKSTLGRLLIRLIDPTAGTVSFEGEDITALTPSRLRKKKRDMQIIFQDPYASLDPRMNVLNIVGEPLVTHGLAKGKELAERVGGLLDMVGLDRSFLSRYPHMFSGGQRQRIGIARALALDPKFIVCDEPVSALDVSIQSQIINLLLDLREKKDLTYFFISHDLNVVRHISDTVCVMFLGKMMEYGPTKDVYERPLHPYSLFLVQAAPVPDPKCRYDDKLILQGEIPSPVNPPDGCRFHTRCPYVQDVCRREEPQPKESGGRFVSCHFPLDPK